MLIAHVAISQRTLQIRQARYGKIHDLIGPAHFSCREVFVMFTQISKEHYLANSGDPDQTANHAASNLDHHC